MAFYNDSDPYAAEWLRRLVAAGHLPAGTVDQRSILDLSPDDLGDGDCHFFAGIGGWPYALSLAGWPRDREVWTGSCPCQPLSSAGRRQGHADERHLWPAFYRLIAERRPATVFGEQVASKDGREWLAGIRADLEHLGYAVGCADLPAASVGAPHIRQRLWWVADAGSARGIRRENKQRSAFARPPERDEKTINDQRGGATGDLALSAVPGRGKQPGRDGRADGWEEAQSGRLLHAGSLADAGSGGRDLERGRGGGLADAEELRRDRAVGDAAGDDAGSQAIEPRARRAGDAGGIRRGGLGDANGQRCEGQPIRLQPGRSGAACGGLGDAGEPGLPAPEREELSGTQRHDEGRATAEPRGGRGGGLGHADRTGRQTCELQPLGTTARPKQSAQSDLSGVLGATERLGADHWAGAVWLPCLDGKARRVEPSIFPLADGVPARVGRLRAYGNAIVPQVGAAFIRAVMEVL